MAGVKNPVLAGRDVSDVPASFVADPFMIRAGGLWHIFFEVMNKRKLRGQIGLAVSADLRKWTYRQIVLDEPFHLSYPYVFRWRGAYYMIPETLYPGCIRLYKAGPFPDRWRNVADLVEGEFADASIVRHGGRWWIFTCGTPYRHDSLRLFHSKDLEGPWTEHKRSPLITGNRHIARPAGRVVRYGGSLIRYAQDCLPSYGTQVHGFRITRLTTSNYREELLAGGPLLQAGGEVWRSSGMHHADLHRLKGRQWVACVDGWMTPPKTAIS